ncbi:MAG: YegS/Rv2252/BmrU family lipid kinase [Prevotellaceae bacterium]|jgi:YegS/Rv2252/BmrU family lipid kinase|nr:YegS/Rv2252/BmrU family lipid kinase [Prevotellaceae bacterium]
MEKQKLAYIVNPISGTADKYAIVNCIEQTINKSAVDLTIHYTTAAGNATEMAAYFASQNFDKVIAVGGDGTINEVAKGLIHTDTIMGIIPVGSGNGLARHLKIPLHYKQAIDVVNKGKVIKIDHGILNDKVFMCTAGIGFDAYIGNHFAIAGKRGFLTYAQLSAKEYFKYKAQNYKITIEGKTFSRRALLITFANASQWGNNAYIAPKADLSDGILDMVVLTPFPLIKVPLMGLRMFTKQLDKSRHIEVFKIQSAMVERESEGYIHFDGEPGLMGRHLNVCVVPHALNILIPN